MRVNVIVVLEPSGTSMIVVAVSGKINNGHKRQRTRRYLLKRLLQSLVIRVCADFLGGFDEPLRLLVVVRLWLVCGS